MKHVKCYKKDYPRPQFVRNEWLNLNGAWDFAFDDKNEGEAKKFYEKFPSKSEVINVPFSYLSPKSGIKDTRQHERVWYKRVVKFTESQLKTRVKLIFEGSDFETKVWVNGQFAGSHKGGYTRFSLDITDLLKAGDNTLTVRAEDLNRVEQPRGKQRWVEKNFACWYEEAVGIHKPVWCEFVNENHITDFEAIPNWDDTSAEFVFRVNAPNGYKVNLDVTWENRRAASGSALVLNGYAKIKLNVKNEGAEWETAEWASWNPTLYDLVFTLTDEKGAVADTVGSYFGYKKIEIKKGKLWINGSQLYLKMLLDQGFWPDGHWTPPSEEAIEKDVKLTLEAGFNGIRKHQKIEDERFYYYCDVYGIIVWAEMPSPYNFNDTANENLLSEWAEAVKQLRNHPCVSAWVPFNESWGIREIHTNRYEQQFTEAVYHLTKTLDRQDRPVISNDGWEHTKSDIITLHNYAPFGQEIIDCYGDIDACMQGERHGLHGGYKSIFANGYKYEGQPLLVSECGGIAFSKAQGNGWGYGEMVKDEASFLARLESLIDGIKAVPHICGYCLTQTTDVVQEKNGVFDPNREPKVSIKEIKRINDKIPVFIK